MAHQPGVWSPRYPEATEVEAVRTTPAMRLTLRHFDFSRLMADVTRTIPAPDRDEATPNWDAAGAAGTKFLDRAAALPKYD